MKYFWFSLLVILSGCSLMPFLIEEIEEGIEFEEDAIKHEIEFRKHKKNIVSLC
jgi:hypothetical protein